MFSFLVSEVFPKPDRHQAACISWWLRSARQGFAVIAKVHSDISGWEFWLGIPVQEHFWASGRGEPCWETPRGAGSCGCHYQPLLLPLTQLRKRPRLFWDVVFVRALFLMENESLAKILTSCQHFLHSLHFGSTKVSINIRRREEILFPPSALWTFISISLYLCLKFVNLIFWLFVLHFTCFFPLLEKQYLFTIFLAIPGFWL